MNDSPPTKSFRVATLLNFFLPGAGQFYLGQRWLGALLAVAFSICFVAALGIFLVGISEYFKLAVDENILAGDHLERIGQAWHPRWLLGLMFAGIAIYVGSLAGLYSTQRSCAPEPGSRPEPPSLPTQTKA